MEEQKNYFALASLILGIFVIPINPILNIIIMFFLFTFNFGLLSSVIISIIINSIFAIIALICGILGIKKSKNLPKKKGKILSIIGIVLSIPWLITIIIEIISYFIFNF